MYKLSKLAAGSAILATAALGSAGIALADGYQPKGKVVYERPSDWSGVYFGVGSGYQWSTVDVDHVPSGVNPGAGSANTGIGISSDHSDGFVSAHLGVQHQFGSVVLGIEGGWMSSIRDKDGSHEVCDSVVGVLANPQLAPGNFCSARLNDVLTIGGRAGWAAGHWMPYVTGGYANAGFDFEDRIPAAGGASALVEQAHARLGGWYIGGGVEWNVSPGWTAGIEYRHYDFGDNTVIAHGPAGGALETVQFDATTDTISARLSWKFGRPDVRPLK